MLLRTSAALAFLLALSPAVDGAPSSVVSPPAVDGAPSAVVAPRTVEATAPRELAALFARYDAMPDGPAREALAQSIDRLAHQRYATVSRLYWHTELAAAQAAARAERKPILSLRMLGRLDEDHSCANSRFFRATLYANARVSKLLRERFVLHWSSERPVPRVTIDLGDGRRIETTTTGNSAHYVLDERGRVLDALPGLYAPAAFEAELGKSLALAAAVRGLDEATWARRVAAHHRRALDASAEAAARLAGTQYLVGGRRIATGNEAIAMAQQAAVMKSVVELPVLAAIGKDIAAIPETDVAQWAALGAAHWKVAAAPRPSLRAGFAPRVLDSQSIALVGALQAPRAADEPPEMRAWQTSQLLARLEHAILADSARNELQLRRSIHGFLALGNHDFVQVNQWVYANVFHTPKSDPWLGLISRVDFTGLPGDGIVRARP